MKSLGNFFSTIFLCCLLLAANGCALWQDHQDKLDAARQKVELKKTRFTALKTALAKNTIKKGTNSEEIRATYGEPDDMFISGSSTSRLDVWTYENVLSASGNDEWAPVILYFDNHKLINWKY